MPERQGATLDGIMTAGTVRASIPGDLDMTPQLAEAIGRHIAESAGLARQSGDATAEPGAPHGGESGLEGQR